MLLKKNGSKNWIFRTMVNGKTWERSTGESDKRKAQAKVAGLMAEAELHRKRQGELPTLEKAILSEADRVESDVSEQQSIRVRDALMNFLKWCRKVMKKDDIPLDKITHDLLEDYQRQRLKEAAKDTVNKELCYMVRLLRNNGLRVDKPKAKKGEETKVREFTDVELEKFFAHCPDHEKPLFLLMYSTGARPAEVVPSERSNHVALLKKEVDTEKKTVKIRTAKLLPGEEERERVIPVGEELMKLLEDAMKQNPGPHVFPTMLRLSRNFNRIIKNAGIEKLDPLKRKLTAHSFRHTWATKMAEAVDGNQFLLSRLLGHKQIATTNRYVHAQSRAAVVEIGQYLRKSPQADPALAGGMGKAYGEESQRYQTVE